VAKPIVRQWGSCKGYRVILVDAAWIRDHWDNDFTDFGTTHFKFIPKEPKQVWVDAATKPSEVKFMAQQAVKEQKLLDSGDNFTRAMTDAEREEQADRKHSAADRAKVKVRQVADYGPVSVWLVDGAAVRAQFSDDFVDGGNGRAYRWMPTNEIWLEDDLGDDQDFIELHEITEWNWMGRGEAYSQAHHKASQNEILARRDGVDVRVLLAQQVRIARQAAALKKDFGGGDTSTFQQSDSATSGLTSYDLEGSSRRKRKLIRRKKRRIEKFLGKVWGPAAWEASAEARMHRGVARGVSAKDALRPTAVGDLGAGVYLSPSKEIASSYGGGPTASVRAGTRVVHSYRLSRQLQPDEVARVYGGAKYGEDVVLVSNGSEIYKGPWGAKQMEAALSKHPKIKMVIGTEKSIGINQIAVRDPSVLVNVPSA
jgi:hypothetical protein